MPEAPPDRFGHLRPSRWPLIALAIGIVGAAAYLLLRQGPRAPPPAAPAAAPSAAPAPQAPAAPEEGAAAPAPDAAATRALLESLSPLDAFRRWVADGDAVRRWAIVTDNVAEGVSPSRQLGGLSPAEPFSVAPEGDGLVIAPRSYHRYDRLADAIAVLDVHAAVSAYRALHGPLEAAYRTLGHPDGSLDRATARALVRLERAPVRDGPVAVVPVEGLYAFAEPRLERLGAVEKQLLRMGPRNARLVQGKAKELREALGLADDPGRAP